MACWVRGGFGSFLATLPEMFSSAGRNVGVLVWHFLGCLPGRLCSISHSARGEGGKGRSCQALGREKSWQQGWGRGGRLGCEEEEEEGLPSASPWSLFLPWKSKPKAGMSKEKIQKKKPILVSSEQPETRSELLLQEKTAFLPGTIFHESSFPHLHPKLITPLPSVLPLLFTALFPHLPFVF